MQWRDTHGEMKFEDLYVMALSGERGETHFNIDKGGTAVRFFVHVHELYFCCKCIIWGKGSMGSSGT